MKLMKPNDIISISTPALTDCSVACLRSLAKPWAIISPDEFQSVTTMPSKPHSLRSTSRSRKSLPVEGMPSISLNEVMSVSAPASTHALKAGKYVFLSERSEIIVEL